MHDGWSSQLNHPSTLYTIFTPIFINPISEKSIHMMSSSLASRFDVPEQPSKLTELGDHVCLTFCSTLMGFKCLLIFIVVYSSRLLSSFRHVRVTLFYPIMHTFLIGILETLVLLQPIFILNLYMYFCKYANVYRVLLAYDNIV